MGRSSRLSDGQCQSTLQFVKVSQSNARVERAVEQLEDLVRTYESAPEARLDTNIVFSHSLMYWIVEHATGVYNK